MTKNVRSFEGNYKQASPSGDPLLLKRIQEKLAERLGNANKNLAWLYENLHPYFFVTMKEETESIINLTMALQSVPTQRRITLVDQDKKLILACLDVPGTLYETLKNLQEREISYAEITHSHGFIQNADCELEIQRFEFDRKSAEEIQNAGPIRVPRKIRKDVLGSMERMYPKSDFKMFHQTLRLLWLNNRDYVRISPPERVARALWLYQQGEEHDGLFLDLEEVEQISRHRETRLLFSVANPKQRGFMTQTSEVFQRLNLGVHRFYAVIINTGNHPYFLGTFYVTPRDGTFLERDSQLFRTVKRELYNTQILSTSGFTYTQFVEDRIMTGEEASLTNAFIAFCHTNLAHNQPDRFDLEAVKSAFQSDPEITLKLIHLFRTRFDPDRIEGGDKFLRVLGEMKKEIENYNTGHRYLDDIRKTVFRTCMLFICHTLKNNFFIDEKFALAFRLDPAYLQELGPEFTSDLPQAKPFRITFFFGRLGVGYHIGFSDIARGGWRTIISRGGDEYTVNSNSLFREVFVLAHTQHLKNKDIYEGGSKMTVILSIKDPSFPEGVTPRLYKLQYSFINAFLDLFVTEKGKAKNPRVVDYYGEDEPIELGPDENMHDSMIEVIATQSLKRGYLLGIGIMSSKHVGINHKEYGVTSRGVVKFAEVAMKEMGVDIHHDPFTVKITGGPNGDVAGNAMCILLERCQKIRILAIAAGSGGLYDPDGVGGKELRRLLLKSDIVDFNPERLHPGGFILFRKEYREDGIKKLHRKVVRTHKGVEESWLTVDEFNKEFDHLIFSVSADLFLPCGGRPETIDGKNWEEMLGKNHTPTAKVIVEGANSYITPDARDELQKRGVVIIRDASANKCGVISSSYEIIANLLMGEKEFLKNKDAYVRDVLTILDKRAEDEANLIFRRHGESDAGTLYTHISDAISREINEHYMNLFPFFHNRPQLLDKPLFRKVILNHLPAFVKEHGKYKARIKRLPLKIKSAILAVEIATSIVYGGGWEMDLEKRLREYLKTYLPR